MNCSARLQAFPIIRFTFIRFGLVSLLGETIYFLLYGLVLKFTDNTSTSLAIAGGICILLNAYTHSRVTFRVKFTWRLLLGYLQIQLLGFAIAFLIGLFLDRMGTNKWVIALLTYAFWATISYLLSKILYRSEGRKARVAHINPEQLQP
jgi:putative flippase GtrA